MSSGDEDHLGGRGGEARKTASFGVWREAFLCF